MRYPCPNCNSEHVEIRNTGRRAGTAVGAVAGAASAASSETALAALAAGASGLLLGSFGSTVLRALAGGVAGAAAGRAAGAVVDDHILDNYRCLDCGCTFSVEQD